MRRDLFLALPAASRELLLLVAEVLRKRITASTIQQCVQNEGN
jgi:hypothetical protein